MRIAFDIGGVLSKYPNVFRPLVELILGRGGDQAYGIEVFIISDMKPHAKAVAFCHDNGFFVPPERILCADYEHGSEYCKAKVCQDYRIDLLIDDHMGYLAVLDNPTVRLFVMPDPDRPYYADDWKTDGSEGNFGRRPEWKRRDFTVTERSPE